MTLGRTRDRLEREVLVELVEELHWHLPSVARRLELSVPALRQRLAYHGIDRPSPVAAAPRSRQVRARQFRRIGPRLWVAST